MGYNRGAGLGKAELAAGGPYKTWNDTDLSGVHKVVKKKPDGSMSVEEVTLAKDADGAVVAKKDGKSAGRFVNDGKSKMVGQDETGETVTLHKPTDTDNVIDLDKIKATPTPMRDNTGFEAPNRVINLDEMFREPATPVNKLMQEPDVYGGESEEPLVLDDSSDNDKKEEEFNPLDLLMQEESPKVSSKDKTNELDVHGGESEEPLVLDASTADNLDENVKKRTEESKEPPKSEVPESEETKPEDQEKEPTSAVTDENELQLHVMNTDFGTPKKMKRDTNAIRKRMGLGKAKEIPQMKSIFDGQPLTMQMYHLIYRDAQPGLLSQLSSDYEHCLSHYNSNSTKDFGLTDDEKVALVNYTGNGYVTINRFGRKLSPLIEKWYSQPKKRKLIEEEMKSLVEQNQAAALRMQMLMQGLAKMPKEQIVTVRSDDHANFKKYPAGTVVSDGGFTSTALHDQPGFDGSNVYVFLTNHGSDVSKVSLHPSEREVLLPPGTMYHIDMNHPNYQYGKNLLTMSEVRPGKQKVKKILKAKIDSKKHPLANMLYKLKGNETSEEKAEIEQKNDKIIADYKKKKFAEDKVKLADIQAKLNLKPEQLEF